MTGQPVWLITGCSSGFGLELARIVIQKGHLVIASSRNPAKTPDLVEEITSKGGHWISLDVASDSMTSEITKAIDIYGQIDVLVNNAGYGINAGFEDSSIHEIEALLKTNLLGPMKAIQTVLPGMRSRRSGTIINFSSTSGLRGLPSVSAYAASKFGLEGFSESLSGECADFGIKVILAEPGPFRTNFGTSTGSERTMSDFYKGTATEKILKYVKDTRGEQPGDPVKAAEQIFDFADGEGLAKGVNNYLRLPLGNTAVKAARAKVEGLRQNFDAVAHIGQVCDF